MAKPELLEVGNNVIEACTEDEFASGYSNGNLYYYDINYQLPRPLTSEVVYDFMMTNLLDQHASPRWNAGFVLGWIAALCENTPEFFYASIIVPQSVDGTEVLPVITL